MCVSSGTTEKQGHCQEQVMQTLRVHLLKTHFFALFQKFWRACFALPLQPPFLFILIINVFDYRDNSVLTSDESSVSAAGDTPSHRGGGGGSISRSGHQLNFFMFPFCEKSLICRQINNPSSGKHYSLLFLPATPSSPSRTLQGLFS